MKHLRKNTPSRVLPLLVLAAVIAGCATTEMTAQWKDPAFSGALTGNRVLVVCQARDDTLRRVCEDQWATRLAAHGVTGISSYSLPGFPPGGAANPEEMAMAGRETGATAVASTQLMLSDFAVVNPGPQVGFGLGGGSGGGYRGGGFSVGGIGLSFPVGGATTTRSLGSGTSLVDLASGAVIWSGSATTSASGDVTSQVGALTQVTIDALHKAGLIR
ncbi:MAG: hypothetical protein IPN75_15805 [Dechloromonas sp.]|uniref:DUF4136 domain-containing protein n=1 Tax=Candidatus Dechloromonas phosphorivorans TaxID=2899244 RepID=A0A9D7LPR4_9RHOO|nr:hypothetical protein [Candidatus Dechloromonas phosphorivorans]